MKATSHFNRRFLATLALIGAAGIAAAGAPRAHAGGSIITVGPAPHFTILPHIAATVEPGGAVLRVTGSLFGAGDAVQVVAVNLDNNSIAAAANTVASLPLVYCTGISPCVHIAGGTIGVSMPPVYVHCGWETVGVHAVDQKSGAQSNTVRVRLGLGPC